MKGDYMGVMYSGRCKECGGLTYLAWEYCEDIHKSIAKVMKRGDLVESFKRYEGDPIINDWCECTKPKKAKKQ